MVLVTHILIKVYFNTINNILFPTVINHRIKPFKMYFPLLDPELTYK